MKKPEWLVQLSARLIGTKYKARTYETVFFGDDATRAATAGKLLGLDTKADVIDALATATLDDLLRVERLAAEARLNAEDAGSGYLDTAIRTLFADCLSGDTKVAKVFCSILTNEEIESLARIEVLRREATEFATLEDQAAAKLIRSALPPSGFLYSSEPSWLLEQAIDCLVEFTHSGNEWQKQAAAAALGEIGGRGVESLLKLLRSENLSTRMAAAHGLSNSNTDQN